MTPGERYRFGPFHLDVAERQLLRDGEVVALTAKTFDLLLILVQGAGRTFTKFELLESLWPGAVVEESNLSQTIFLLRKALGESGDGSEYILTVPRRGYKFIGSVSQQDVTAAGVGPEPGLPVPSRISRLWPVIAALATVALAVLAFVHFREGAPEARVIRSTILPPEGTSFSFSTNLGPMALSPDGRRMVFAATRTDGKSQLWLRSLDAGTAQPLAGTQGGQFPFWSPDSRWVAFVAGEKLKKIDTQGGPPIELADAGDATRGSWGANGTIVFSAARRLGTPLIKIPAGGGTVSLATAADPAAAHRSPWFLPDGEHFLFEAVNSSATGGQVNLLVGSLRSNTGKLIGKGDSNAIYAQGRLLYLRGSTLMAQPFDLKALRITSEAVAVAERVQTFDVPAGEGAFSASDEGLLAYHTGNPERDRQLTWFDRAGKPIGIVGDPRPIIQIRVSPDQRRLAATFVGALGAADLWIYDMARGLPARFTFDPGVEMNPVWSPDGRTIAFSSTRKGHYDLYRKLADGSGPEELLYADNQDKVPGGWSPDAKYLLYTTVDEKAHIFVLPLNLDLPGAAPLKPVPFPGSGFRETGGQFSPDGRWVAYVSDESGQAEIYVAPFSRLAQSKRVSTAGGWTPRWRQDGKELFYRGPTGLLMAAEVRITGEKLEVGVVRTLFNTGIPGGPFALCDISADGQRILVAARPAQKAPEPITLIQNWTAALKK